MVAWSCRETRKRSILNVRLEVVVTTGGLLMKERRGLVVAAHHPTGLVGGKTRTQNV